MILHDPYALHRKWWDHDWVPSITDTTWTDWDYILAEVGQIIDDYTDSESGQWMPWDQSGDVWWETGSIFSGAKAEIQKEMDKRGKELEPGESLYAYPVFGDKVPTLQDWFKSLAEGKADRRPSEHRDARPPTPDELKALREAMANSVE